MFGSKKNKYCCGWFLVLHQQPKTSDCIRVFKLRLLLGHLEIHYAVGDTGKCRGVNVPGLQRIVIGGNKYYYYTPDHYKTFIQFKY